MRLLLALVLATACTDTAPVDHSPNVTITQDCQVFGESDDYKPLEVSAEAKKELDALK